MDDLLADFLTETTEALAEADQALLRLERAPTDHATLSLIFRLVHTIKGTCGFLGLPRLERVTHSAENVLGRVRDGALAVTPDLVTGILRALDGVKLIVAGLSATGAEPPGDDSGVIACLDALAAGQGQRAPDPAPSGAEPGTPAPPNAVPSPDPPAGNTIRVGVDVLEDLMTLVSELVLARNQLLQLARSREDAALAASLQRLSHLTSDLQKGVMKTRMQPIGSGWAKLPRLVRDLSSDLGKQIVLTMHGRDTELDRQLLELIRDPLTHMIRNSADHGLETPAERIAAGKPEQGRITLSAFHQGGQILITIADDGRGLPVDRIKAKALQRGLATEADLAAMSDAQIQGFIFRAGFSTASEVTAVSGRGVGMDVVRTNIEQIGGSIALASRPGEGTTFTIKIPLTLAIVSALIVETAGERFAIPQTSVVELVQAATRQTPGSPARGTAGAATIEHVDGTPVLRLREQLLPLVELSALLELPRAETQEAGRCIVVATVGASTVGLIVDRVFDTEEIVVKPVAPILRHITMFSGNTILGDGSVIMILDPAGIARAAGLGSEAEAKAPAVVGPPGVQADDRTAILLFRAGSQSPMAVPLGLVSRLERISRDAIEMSGGRPVTQYRGKLMPLVPIGDSLARDGTESVPILVFTDGDRSMGLVVDELIDVVTARLAIELHSRAVGVLGTALIEGRSTDVIDTAYWLDQAGQDWFRPPQAAGQDRPRILLIEDSEFFRQLVLPALSASGYDATAVASAAQAFALRDAGEQFDAIISDIEMPEMDGLAFARRVRGGGPWARLPLLALSGRSSPADSIAATTAGFTETLVKFDRDATMAALGRCLAARAGPLLAAGPPQ